MSQGLRIGLLSPTFLPNTGGVQVGLHNIALRLQARGHRPVVVTASHYVRQLETLGWTLPYALAGLPRRPWKWLARHPSLVFFLMDQLLGQLQRRYRFDCWHGTLAYPSGLCLIHFARKHGLPHFIRCAGDDIQRDAQSGYGHRLDPQVDQLVRRWLPRSQAVTAISDSVAEEYRELDIADSRIYRIPNGVDLSRFDRAVDSSAIRARYGIPADDVVFLCVGRNHAKKDFPTLVKAFGRYCQAGGPGARLVIVGRGSSDLAALGAECGVAERLLLLENIGSSSDQGLLQVPGDDLVDLYRSADLFVFPSRMETFGIVLVEAMAAGLPVISTDAPGCRDILGRGQYGPMLPVGDEVALAETMQRLAEQPGQRRHWSELSLQRAQDFSWDRVVDRYLDLYRLLTKNR